MGEKKADSKLLVPAEKKEKKKQLDKLAKLKKRLYNILDEILDINSETRGFNLGKYAPELTSNLRRIEESVKLSHLCANRLLTELQKEVV